MLSGINLILLLSQSLWHLFPSESRSKLLLEQLEEQEEPEPSLIIQIL